MKKTNLVASFIFLLILSVSFSCNQATDEEQTSAKIENTLQSVSFLSDTLNHDPGVFLAQLEKVNAMIDSIGYPDAGYKIWVVQNDEFTDYRYMINGYWPDQAAYDAIHENELYKNAWDEEIWEGVIWHSYNRFSIVK